MRQRVRDHLEALIATRPTHRRSHHALAKDLGIDVATLSRIRNLKGGIGVHQLLRLRELTQTPLDDLLGLAPVKESALQRELVAAIEAALDRRFPGEDPAPASVRPAVGSSPRASR